VKIIAPRAEDREARAEDAAANRQEDAKGGRRERTVPRIRMASYVSYKGKIVLAPFCSRRDR